MDSSTSAENSRLISNTNDKKQPDRPLPTLKECSPTWIWRVGVHLLLIGVPITYLVILAIVGDLDGEYQHAYGDDILEILQIASTLWPISFAAVLGPFLKTLALFKAERGATVASLEFLLSGQTTVSAFKSLFTLQHLRIWTIGIVAVWCLSPLGGQAIVRCLSLEADVEVTELPATHYFSQIPLKYFSLHTDNVTGDTNAFSTGAESMFTIPDFRRVAMAALSGRDILISHANRTHPGFNEVRESFGGMSQVARLSQQDMWQNVRIPLMEYLLDYDAENPTAWTLIRDMADSRFSSFIGVPIRGGSKSWGGNSSMILKTRYQTLECSDHLNGTDWVQTEKLPPVYFHDDILNATSGEHIHAFPEGRDTGTKPGLWLDVLKTNGTDEHLFSYNMSQPSTGLQLLVGGKCSQGPMDEYTGMRICNVSTSYVDVGVECKRADHFSDLECGAKRIRRSGTGKYSPMLSDLSEYQIAGAISFEMPSITATYNPRLPSLLEKYIRNPPTAFNYEEDDDKRIYGACYKDVPREDFEARMATALNTFLMASYNHTVLTGADGTNLTQRNDMWQSFNATWSEYRTPMYSLSVPWYCISMISTIILLACSVSNAVLRHLIVAPDVLGSVDGLIRDSPYVKIDNESSEVSSGVSSQDRIRYTKGIYVQIQDVQPDGNMGKIALTSDVRRSRLDWKRVYTN